ncbi:MAG: hypothetical protein ACI3YT_03840, partial [Prevotella sp.]
MNRLINKTSRLITTLLLTIITTANVNSVELPSYIVILQSDTLMPNVSDSCLWEKALPIYFKINKAEISRSDAQFIELTKALKNLSKEFSLCKLMVIRSSASPEGGYDNNKRLAHKRSTALVDSLKRHLVIPDSTVEERYMHEDYEGLRRMLLKSDKPYKNKV